VTEQPMIVGLGRVKVVKEPDPNDPKATFGMAIELMRVTRESREVILRMLERRKQLGLPEVGIPMPADIDAARRAEVIDTSVKNTASTAVPAPQPTYDSGPSEALLTAPRRQSGSIAVAKLHVIEALGPEPARRKRPLVHEVIESASGPIVSMVSVPGLDEDVDVGAVLARARALAGGNLDAELEALREISAAPLEISIEAASAELARQLGGRAVNKKDRSARWATPPATISAPVEVKAEPQAQPIVEPVVEPVPEPEPALDTAPSVPAIANTPTFIDDEDSGPLHAAPVEDKVEDSIAANPAAQLIDDNVDPQAFEDREASANEVDPDQIADEIHQLGEEDFEEVEHTQIGAMPSSAPEPEPGFQHHAFVTEPAAAAELERSLDQHMAEAEAEADADDLGISGAYAMPAPADDVPQETEGDDEEIDEIDDFEILAEADAADADLLSAHGEADAGEVAPEPRAPAQLVESQPEHERRPSHADFVSRLDLSDEFEAAPEADAPEGDLDPRQVSAGHALAAFDEPDEPVRRSPFDEPGSYGDGPSGTPDDLDVDSQYTLAGDLPPPDAVFDAPHTGFGGHRAYEDDEDEIDPHFPRPHSFDQSDVPEAVPVRRAKRVGDPYALRPPATVTGPPPAAGDEGFDLETALEALDVDLDDLSVPHERPSADPLPRAPSVGPRSRTPSMRPPSQQRAASRSSGSIKVPAVRPTTDDGVLIQFDDDED
ncbi:MAG: hypothetical protein ABI175_29600, partial [Polyangiales bacterium]